MPPKYNKAEDANLQGRENHANEELNAMYLGLAIDFLLGLTVVILTGTSIQLIRDGTPARAQTSDPLYAGDFLERYVTATLVIESVVLLVMALTFVYWRWMYKELMSAYGYKVKSNSFNWSVFWQVGAIVIMALAYLMPFTAFGLSCSFRDLVDLMSANPPTKFTTDQQEDLRTRLTIASVCLLVSLLAKVIELALGHGWSVTKKMNLREQALSCPMSGK